MTGKKIMNASDAARIQSSQARSGGDMSSKGFPARAQSAAQSNINSGLAQNTNSANRGSSQSGGNAGSVGTSSRAQK